MNFIDKLDKVIRKIEFVIVMVAGVAAIFLTFLTVIDVGMRYIFLSPIPGASESTELILPWIVFLGMAYTLRVGGHVRVTLVTDRVPSAGKNFLDGLDCIIGLFFFGVLTFYSWRMFAESFLTGEFMMATIKLPWWIGKFSMPAGLAVMTIRYPHQIFENNYS